MEAIPHSHLPFSGTELSERRVGVSNNVLKIFGLTQWLARKEMNKMRELARLATLGLESP